MSATKFSSCVDIKASCPSCKSGFYKTPYNGEIVEYFCDMETDGGKSTDKAAVFPPIFISFFVFSKFQFITL